MSSRISLVQQQNYTFFVIQWKMVPCTSTKSTIKFKTTPKASDGPIVKKKGETNNISWLIALCLQMPPIVLESDDDLDLADKNSDEDDKQKKDTCSNNDCISEQSNAC